MAVVEGSWTSGVQVFIPAALNRPTHTLYSICMAVQPTAQEWTVNRRYSQFLTLKKDVLKMLTHSRADGQCPGCSSFGLVLQKFPFPQKSLMRTNSVVRRRVSSLQDFLKLLVERVYNDLPKCAYCGDKVKKILHPFLIRGAQPLNGSIISKIQTSLSLDSFAAIRRSQIALHMSKRIPDEPSALSRSKRVSDESPFNRSKRVPDESPLSRSKRVPDESRNFESSYASTESSNPSSMGVESPSNSKERRMSDASSEDDGYGYHNTQYGDERCHDPKVPLAEAMKQVVLPAGVRGTCEEIIVRLSSMWAAYDIDEALASLGPDQRPTIRKTECAPVSEDELSDNEVSL